MTKLDVIKRAFGFTNSDMVRILNAEEEDIELASKYDKDLTPELKDKLIVTLGVNGLWLYSDLGAVFSLPTKIGKTQNEVATLIAGGNLAVREFIIESLSY